MIELAIQGTSAGYLVFVGTAMNTKNLRSAFILQWVPITCGSLLGCLTFAQFMGWPV